MRRFPEPIQVNSQTELEPRHLGMKPRRFHDDSCDVHDSVYEVTLHSSGKKKIKQWKFKWTDANRCRNAIRLCTNRYQIVNRRLDSVSLIRR